MKQLVYMLTLITAVGCGRQIPEQTSDTTTDASTTKSVSTPVVASSVKTEDGQYAKLVQLVTDVTCTDKNVDQLIYAKSDRTFYYCDDVSLQWTSIDIQAEAAVGKDGSNGKDGKDGTEGIAGKNGSSGKDGKDGNNGKDGVDGINGSDGINGTDGSKIVGVYALAGTSPSNAPNTTIKMPQVILFSDGSLSFSAQIYYNGVPYFPSGYIAENKKLTSQMMDFDAYINAYTLKVTLPAGQTLLTGLNAYLANPSQYPNYGITVGITIGNFTTSNLTLGLSSNRNN